MLQSVFATRGMEGEGVEMGGNPYWYFTEYRGDVASSLAHLRRREFEAGRYEPAMAVFPIDKSTLKLSFPIDPQAPTPGAQHATMEDAFAAAERTGDGTRSILDIVDVADQPVPEKKPKIDPSTLNSPEMIAKVLLKDRLQRRRRVGFRISYPVPAETLLAVFGTEHPSHVDVERGMLSGHNPEADQLWDEIDRGTARHIVVYDGDAPIEVFFVGYSFD